MAAVSGFSAGSFNTDETIHGSIWAWPEPRVGVENHINHPVKAYLVSSTRWNVKPDGTDNLQLDSE